MHLFLRYDKVCQLDVTVGCEEDVFELDLPMQDTIFVQELDSQAYLCAVEAV